MEQVLGDGTSQEHRVRVVSKKQVTERVNKYKNILKSALRGQPEVDEETKRVLIQELLAVGQTGG